MSIKEKAELAAKDREHETNLREGAWRERERKQTVCLARKMCRELLGLSRKSLRSLEITYDANNHRADIIFPDGVWLQADWFDWDKGDHWHKRLHYPYPSSAEGWLYPARHVSRMS